ncbi:MAG TPA: hypothetical protein VEB64_02930 [Azospirillaceae bacterium]|nr:hypothetical protein [Azospirillaceae bacterium]
MPDIWSANTRTTGRIGLTGVKTGTIDTVDDRDWLRINLQSGRRYSVVLVGYTLHDPFLQVFNRQGVRVADNDDAGGSLDSGLIFRASYTGYHYLAASSSVKGGTGTYGMAVRSYTPSTTSRAATSRARTMAGLLDQAAARPLTSGAALTPTPTQAASGGLLAAIGT